MTKDEIIASLIMQMHDRIELADGDDDSIFAHDADALREAIDILENTEELEKDRGVTHAVD